MNKWMHVVLAGLITGTGAIAAQAADTYGIDKAHTAIGFHVRHMGIVNVAGRFNDFEGHVKYDGENLESLSVHIEIDSKSIDTNNERRDEHLRNEDFFEVETYPKVIFKSTKVEQRNGEVIVHGQLTMKKETKDVELKATLSGPVADPWGNQRIGLELAGSVMRHDYGVGFDGASDKMIGSEVKLDVQIQAIKQ